MTKSLGIAATMVALAACTQQNPDPSEPEGGGTEPAQVIATEEEMQSFDLGGQSYTMPAEYISALRLGGESSFVKMKHPDFPAEIVFDGKSAVLTDETGAPQIFSINDAAYPNLEYHDRANGTVVCRIGMAAQSACGTRFEQGGSNWSLLFPTGNRDQADQLVERAITILNRYSRDAQQP